MNKHTFRMPVHEIAILFFNIANDDLEGYLECFMESISEDTYEFCKTLKEDVRYFCPTEMDEEDNFQEHQDKVRQLVVIKNPLDKMIEEISSALSKIEKVYADEEDIKLNIFIDEDRGNISKNLLLAEFVFTIETNDLENVMRLGMNAYGVFDWDGHSVGEKKQMVEDGYYVLREMLHYHEACEYKIKLDMPNYEDLYILPSADAVFEQMGEK